jgi:hypothetical protein
MGGNGLGGIAALRTGAGGYETTPTPGKTISPKNWSYFDKMLP